MKVVEILEIDAALRMWYNFRKGGENVYERMLDKRQTPAMADMTAWCGENGERFAALNEYLTQMYGTEASIVFPYGNNYGWGVAHRIKRKLVCNVFAENGAFSVMVRLSDRQIAVVYPELQPYAQRYIDGKYPCGDGGWIHYRVSGEAHLVDIRAILDAKISIK